MKKIFYIFAALLLVATACSRIDLSPTEQDGDRITFTMNLNVPERSVLTKTMGDVPGKDLKVYVFVFGDKGNLNDFVQAIPAGDGDFVENTETHHFYKKYIISLKATDSEQHVHVVATNQTITLATMLNGSTTVNESVMDAFKTEGTDDAYWQYLYLGDGTNGDGAADAFNNLKLVRNFAKVTVALKKNDSGASIAELPQGVTDFEVLGFEVYNKPTTGTFVIKNNGAYFPAYSTYDASMFEALRKAYPGYMFSETDIDTENAGKFPEGHEGGKVVDYLYERTVSSIKDNPTYVIMKCSYNDANETSNPVIRYYRIDLVDQYEDYLPIYRNFMYKLVIKSVGKRGYETISEAQEHSSNGNISLDPAMQELDDISDGVSRMYVQYIEKVFVQSTAPQTGYFRYKYLPDAEDENASIAATLTNPDNTSIVVSDDWASGGTKANDNWFDLEYTLPANMPAGVSKFTVTGTDPNHASKKLIRTIRIRVEPRKSFSLYTIPSSITVGRTGQVSVTLPDLLPASMFPLELKFEDTAGALNPSLASDDGKDLVAGGGLSLSGSGVNAVQFTKTISYDTYLASSNKTFTATFKRISSGQTTLYVGNEYFTAVYGSVN